MAQASKATNLFSPLRDRDRGRRDRDPLFLVGKAKMTLLAVDWK